MKAFSIVLAVATVVVLGGCETMSDMDAPGDGEAQAEIRNSAGTVVAHAMASDIGDAVRVRVEAERLAPGTYGTHVHMTGRCDPPGFESAGGHWNPTERHHGSLNPQGPHMGDLPNLSVGTGGEGSIEFTIPGASLTGGVNALLDADGAAVVIHANADDYRSDPSGNSGARIACGVLS